VNCCAASNFARLLFKVRTVDIEFNLTTESVEQTRPIEPLCVEPSEPIRSVLRLLKDRKTPSVLVCRDRALIGIFTERDALKVLAHGTDLDAPISQVMVATPVTVRSGESVGAAVQKMARGGYRRLPIVNEAGRPLGIVQVSGIVHYLVEHFPKTIYNLPPQANRVAQQREGP
jgi:CBS domain-containing protein